MFPQELIDKIKNEIDLLELAKEYTELKKAGSHVYKGICPNPDHNDTDPSFTVFKKGYKNGTKINSYDTWCCYGCHNGKKSNNSVDKNLGSDCIAFIQWIKKCDFNEAVLYLCKKYNIPVPKSKNYKILKKNKAMALKYYLNLKGEPLEYLKSRGLSFSDCREYGLGVTFDNERIVFPLFDRMNNILGFTKRWIHMNEDRDDKYRNSQNSEVFTKGMYFYNINHLDTDFNEIRITEGPLDAILASKYGAKNVVATLGTAFTEEHADIIKHYNMVPVFIYDGDEAGLKAINRAIVICAEKNIYCKILILPGGNDLADFSLLKKNNIENYIKENSVTYGNFLINNEIQKYLSKLNELKLKSYPKLLSVLKKVPDPSEKEILKAYIDNIMNIKL